MSSPCIVTRAIPNTFCLFCTCQLMVSSWPGSKKPCRPKVLRVPTVTSTYSSKVVGSRANQVPTGVNTALHREPSPPPTNTYTKPPPARKDRSKVPCIASSKISTASSQTESCVFYTNTEILRGGATRNEKKRPRACSHPHSINRPKAALPCHTQEKKGPHSKTDTLYIRRPCT